MHLRAGTSGYSYKEWKGSFYPSDLAAKDMLAYYAERLPTVEINNTFYRLPRANVLETWASQVPEDFRFAVKASRRITHLKRLKEVGEETTYLLETLQVLGDKLGLVLFQLPPNMKKDLDRFDAFLDLLPGATRAVFEFRHDSWIEEDVLERLRDRDLAIVIAETDEKPEPDLVTTADYGYLRLRGTAYDDTAIDAWAARLREAPWEEAYVFFKHEDEGTGPPQALALLERC